MNVLVVNCGSSSLKYQLIDSDSEAVLAKGLCERTGIPEDRIRQRDHRSSNADAQTGNPDGT